MTEEKILNSMETEDETEAKKREKYLFTVSCQNAKFLRDVVEAGALKDTDYEKEIERIYEGFAESGELPSKETIKILLGIDIKTTGWDLDIAYRGLCEINRKKYFSSLATLKDKNPLDIDAAVERLRKKYKTHYGSEEGHLSIGSHEDFIAALKQSEDAMQNNIMTGFSRLARVVSGDDSLCWCPSSLYSIMGLSGYGKSIFLANYARDSLEQGYNVLYITTEMSEVAISKRIAKSYYQITNMKELPAQKKPWAGHLDIFKVHPNDCTYLDIQSIIDNLEYRPDIIYIDYADELKAHEHCIGDYEAQGVVYTGLKILAEKNNVPVVTATQTNRSAEGDKGGTKDYVGYSQIADSTKKIRLVDILASIVQSPEDKTAGVINLHIIKNRNGATAKLSYYINYDKMLLTEREGEGAKIEKPVEKVEMPRVVQ